MNIISLSREDLTNFAQGDIGFYGLDISRISGIFIAQVMQLQKNRIINTHTVLDEVKYLEGIKKTSSTKKPEVFKKPPLKGLRKKHFTDASLVLKNLGAHFGYKYRGNKTLDSMVNEVFANNKSGYVDNEFINQLTYNATIRAFQERAKANRLTGEWIVYQEHKGKNYYLTLAAHDEGDENIFKRVNDAYDFNFKFLRDHANAQ